MGLIIFYYIIVYRRLNVQIQCRKLFIKNEDYSFFSPFCWTQVQEHYPWVDQVSRYLEINAVKSENFHCFPILMYFFFFFSFHSSKYSYLLIFPNINFDFLSSLALKSFPPLYPSSNCICYFIKKPIRFPMPNLITPAVCGTRFNVAAQLCWQF